MISESLLEFEESLAEMSGSCNSIMLDHLDLMADLNRFSVAALPERSIEMTQIAKIFSGYNYAADEVTLCPTCRGRISANQSSCCTSYIATVSQGFASNLEADFWHSFIENTYKTLLTLPHYSKVAFFQVGVPFQLRPVVWQKLILVNQKNLAGIPDEAKVLFKNFQHSYNREISKQIKKDLTRTFPQMHFFSVPETVDSLLTILNVYANYDLDLGYCQGLLFLVGTLFYHLRDQESTFHALCKIMECEPELRSIFVPATMSTALDRWYREFWAILSSVDSELARHLASFCDCKVFLYQWWLSVTLIHAPDFTVNNRIVDFCLMEGWKVGIFKISVGLLRCNRPILMSFGDGDEEVVYQHLLNESKWGHVINNSTAFFGDTLLSMDEGLFAAPASGSIPPMAAPAVTPPKKKASHARTGSSVLGMLKSLTITPGGSLSKEPGSQSATSLVSADSFATNESRSSLSLLSPSRDTESIYSNATSLSWDRPAKYRGRKSSFSDSGSIRTTSDDLATENDTLKALLRKAYASLGDESLKRDISRIIEHAARGTAVVRGRKTRTSTKPEIFLSPPRPIASPPTSDFSPISAKRMTPPAAASPQGTPPQTPAQDASRASLLQEKPLSPAILVHEAPVHESAPYVSIVLNQLSILLATASDQTWTSHHRQIRYILSTERRFHVLHVYFYRKLVASACENLDQCLHQANTEAETQEQTPPADSTPLTPVELIFRAELAHLARDCTFLEFILPELATEFGPRDSSSATTRVLACIDRYAVDPVLAFTLVSRLADPEAPAVKQFFEEAAATVPALVLERSTAADRSWCHVLLDCILRSPTYPFLHKLSTIGQFNAFDSTIPPVQAFFRSILKMSFKELLLEIGPDNLLPEKLLPSLLQIKPEDADASIALVLAEILIPGSQGLSAKNGGITSLTFVNNLPEANAKGAQLQACLKTIDSHKSFRLDWGAIFARVHDFLHDAARRNSQPSVASITQLFSALDYKTGPLDVFLCQDWWFEKTLMFMLQSMYTKPGAFDVMNSKHLALCYDDELSNENQLLKFVNVAKLEIRVMDRMSTQATSAAALSESDKKLHSWLTQFFDLHCRHQPHQVIAGALAISVKDGFILDRIDRLFAFMMERPWVEYNVTQLGKVISKFKEIDPQLAVSKLIDFYSARGTAEALTRVVETATTFDFFDELATKAKTITYSLYLMFLFEATRMMPDVTKLAEKLKLDLENDLRDPKVKTAAHQGLLEILEVTSADDYDATQQHSQQRAEDLPLTPFRPLKVAVVYVCLEALKGLQGLIDPERLKNLQVSLLTTYPRLINYGTGHDAVIVSNEMRFSNWFPPPVDQEMKTFYSKMYNKSMDPKDIVEILGRMKSSDSPHEQDVFACMIHSLIDEYKFFSEYPLNALATTSLLFGALLQKDLVQGSTLTVALNFIWEACNQPHDSRMFKFAVQSLYNFKSRLHEYPMYCKHLLTCPTLPAHAKIYQIVKDAANGIPCPEASTSQPASSGDGNQAARSEVATVNYNSIASVKRTVGFAAQEDPNEAVSDKLLFFVNNMTADNMLAKLAEVKSLFAEKYFSWFASYLVTERAKTEPNNHTLYTNLVFALENPIFYEYVLNVTLFEVGKLLKNFKDTSTERLHLKNLGAWLGKITLANDRPLKRDQVALKYLLVESFDFKTLHIVIPFVCKILEQASYSRVFRCPNPWVLGVLKVLVELYECADLKLNLKFEIEVLLNALEMKIKDIEASTLIRTHNPQPEALAAMFGTRTDIAGVMDIANLAIDGPEQGLQMQQHLQQQAAIMQQQQQQHLSQLQHLQQLRQMDEHVPQTSVANQLEASFSNLVGNTIFTQNPNLRRAFQASLARAVRECAIPILSRVSEAVLSTTEALIRKDFATEGDISKFRNSYQKLAQQLAHSMVVCSGRKILSETVEATMLQLLGNQISSNELPLIDLSAAIQSNVHLCVEIVEKLAVSNISELIEDRMRSQVLSRERIAPGERYIDESASTYALQLPPPLGMGADGLTEAQLQIYSSFGTNSMINRVDTSQAAQLSQQPIARASPSVKNLQPVAQLTPQQTPQKLAPQGLPGFPQEQHESHELAQSSMNRANDGVDGSGVPLRSSSKQVPDAIAQDDSSADQLFSFITQMCDKAIQTLSGLKENALNELPADHPILQSLTQALALCQSNAIKHPELLLKVAQYAVNCLFTQVHENPMSNEIYVVILDKLCECSPSTAKDVTWWMVHSSDQRKFNMPVIFSLLKVQLVTPLKLDSSIGKLIAESNSPVLVKFAASLLLNVFSSDGPRPIALRSEFACTLDALLHYDPEDTEEHKKAAAMRDDLFKLLNELNIPLSATEKKESDGFVQMGYIFVEWVKLVGHSENSVALQNAFIDKLFLCGILTEPERFQTFFRAAIEISTTAFVTEHEIRSRTQREVLLSVDCLALLISRILLKFSKAHTKEAADYMKIIFDIIVLVLVNEHEGSKSTWNERAYFKLFSSLMCSWSDASAFDKDATAHLDESFYASLGDVLDSVQPLICAGFTFAWISLIAHRMFLPKLLDLPEKKGYNTAVKVLSSLLKFQSVYSKDKLVQHDVILVIFKAINRIFTALGHDSPEFLIDCHYELISVVPSSYIQVRNIILSAIPRDMTVPSPFSKGLNWKDLPGCTEVPGVHYEPFEDLCKAGLKKPVENYIRIPAAALLRTIHSGLRLNYAKEDPHFGFKSVTFNTRLVNALVLHVGISAVEDKLPRDAHGFNPNASHTSLLVELLNHGCTEFRYHLLEAVANQLRAPNCHTQWFIGFLIHIFEHESAWASDEIREETEEILVRVLLERHLVNKPHPWGLSFILTELVSKEQYGFFARSFIKRTPELRGVFDTLAKNATAS